MTTPRQKRALARATRKREKRAKHAREMMEHRRRQEKRKPTASTARYPNLEAHSRMNPKRDSDDLQINAVLDQLPEGAFVEKLANGNLQVSVRAKRSEADETRQHLVDIVESNGLTTEGSDDDALHE